MSKLLKRFPIIIMVLNLLACKSEYIYPAKTKTIKYKTKCITV